jgi:hypothetical protein
MTGDSLENQDIDDSNLLNSVVELIAEKLLRVKMADFMKAVTILRLVLLSFCIVQYCKVLETWICSCRQARGIVSVASARKSWPESWIHRLGLAFLTDQAETVCLYEVGSKAIFRNVMHCILENRTKCIDNKCSKPSLQIF